MNKTTVNDYLNKFLNDFYKDTDLYKHFNKLENNKSEMSETDLLEWELEAEKIYFKDSTHSDLLNIYTNQINTNYKEIFTNLLYNYNTVEKLELELWINILNIDYENIYQLFIITLLNVLRPSITSKNSENYITYNNLHITLLQTFKINTESSLKSIKPTTHKPKIERGIKKINQKLYEDNDKSLNKIITLIIKAGEYSNIFKKELIQTKKNNLYYTKYENIIKINPSLTNEIIRLIIVYNFRPPLVIKPKNYKLYEKDIYLGGYPSINENNYEYNRKLTRLIIKKNDINIELTNKYINNINYLQSTPLKIDCNKLKSILEMNTAEFYKIIDIDLTILDVNPINYNTQYINQRSQACIILSSLWIARTFSNIKIFLIWTCEGRGRIVCSNTPLSFYSNKVLRNLFVLYNTNDLTSIDATASAFQIMGGFLGEDKLLNLTNVYCQTEKNDLYSYISNKLSEKIDYKKINEIYTQYTTSLSNEDKALYNITNDLNTKMLENIKNFNRNTWKHFIMTWAYNKGRNALKLTLLKDILKIPDPHIKNNKYITKLSGLLINPLLSIIKKEFPLLKLLKKFIECYSYYNSSNDLTICLTTKNYSHKTYQNYIYQESRKIYEYTINNKIIKISNEILEKLTNMKINENTNYKTKIRGAIYKKQPTNKTLQEKTRIATMPNLVHYTDASILMHVLTNCRLNNIPIITVHDCFYSSHNYMNEIRKFYIEGYIKYVIKDNVIDYFIKDMNNIIKNLYNKKFTKLNIINQILLIYALKLNNKKTKLMIKNKRRLFKEIRLNKKQIINNIDNHNEKLYMIKTLITNKIIKNYKNSDLDLNITVKKSTKFNNIINLIKTYFEIKKIRNNMIKNDKIIKNKIKNSKYILC